MLSMSDLGEVVARANEHLCEGNEADMFVTCWVGILDEGTGTLTYVNAGTTRRENWYNTVRLIMQLNCE